MLTGRFLTDDEWRAIPIRAGKRIAAALKKSGMRVVRPDGTEYEGLENWLIGTLAMEGESLCEPWKPGD